MSSPSVVPLTGSIADLICTKLALIADEARRGEYVAIAIVAVTVDGGNVTASLPADHLFTLVGALERAKLELLNSGT